METNIFRLCNPYETRPLWRWRVSVDFITAAENTENTSLSMNYYDVKAVFLLFSPETFIIITSAVLCGKFYCYRQLKGHYYELYG